MSLDNLSWSFAFGFALICEDLWESGGIVSHRLLAFQSSFACLSFDATAVLWPVAESASDVLPENEVCSSAYLSKSTRKTSVSIETLAEEAARSGRGTRCEHLHSTNELLYAVCVRPESATIRMRAPFGCRHEPTDDASMGNHAELCSLNDERSVTASPGVLLADLAVRRRSSVGA